MNFVNTLRFGKRRPSIRQPAPQPVLAVPHVIDISAPPPDEEIEERQRLKDAAAQSIGLGPLLEPPEEAEEHKENEAEEEEEEEEPLPPFPASPALLAPFVTLADSLPKYYPPSSLRIFALAKQWKGRHLLLSLPLPRTRTRTAPAVAHLHLFKGPAPDERELERLEINADSVVFVADDTDAVSQSSSGWHVVKVAGADVGALKRDWNPTDDAGRTVWLLQLASPADAQRWISAIKSAILEQRTHRAGLAPTLTPNSSSEPRGDMDVMLSLRLQASGSAPHTPRLVSAPHTPRLVSAPTPPTATQSQPPTPTSPTYPRPLTTHGHPAQNGYAPSLAPSTSAASNYANSESGSRSVRSVATAPAPSTSFLPSSNSFNPFSRSASASHSDSTKHKSRSGSDSNKHKSRSASSSSSATTTARSSSNPGTISASASGTERGGRPTTAVAALKGLFSGYGGSAPAASASQTHITSGASAAARGAGNRPRSSSGASFVSVGSRSSSYAPSGLGIGRAHNAAAHTYAHGHPARATSLSGPTSTGLPYRANVRASSASADELLLPASAHGSVGGNPNGAESFGRMGALLGEIHAQQSAGGVGAVPVHAPRARPSTSTGAETGGGRSMNTSTSTGTLVGVGGGLERRIVGTREELASHSNPNGGGNGAGAGDADEEGQELIAPKRRTLSSLGLPFGLGAFGGSGTPLQPPPRRKRWTGGSFSSATSTGTGATGSASKWEKSSRRDRERAAISEDGHGYGGASNGYATHSRANGRPGSAGSLHSHRPGSSNGQSHRPGSSSGGTMYAHPHASGSSGTAGSFGVRSSIAGGGGGGSNRGSVYAGSVRTFEEAGSMPREGAGAGSGAGGRARTPSVRTRAESVGTRESIREEEGERERDGEDEGRLSVNGHGYGDGRSERSVSTGTGRSRASSGAGHTSGNPNLNGNGNANGNANTNANGKTRRWSTLPRRLTPPASPPPAPPAVLHSGATIPHPYAAVASSSPDRERDRDRDRPGSRSSFGSTKWTSRGGKRVSTGGVSGVSIGSVGGASSGSAGSASIFGPPPPGGGVSGLSGLSGSPPSRTRTSMPPPPRPAPTGALPPAPVDSPNSRTSFRESRAPSLSVSFLDVPGPPSIASSKSLPLTGSSGGSTSTTPTPPASVSNSTKASFRESMSMTHRALRLSLMAPKPPPAGVLPPRPDEVALAPPPQTHRRSNSATGPGTGAARGSLLSNLAHGSGSLQSIPASPASPPPRGPLPPTPALSVPPPLALVRHTSLKLKKRLRILSAPPAPHPAEQEPPHSSQERLNPEPAPRPTSLDVSSRPRGVTLSSFLSASTPTTPTIPGPIVLPATIAAALARLDGTHENTPPQTPIGEKIIQFHTQNDPSFLELSAASTPILRPLPALPSTAVASDPPAPENEYAEIVSLLPPPRRGSRQISVKELERLERVPTPPVEPELVPLPRDQEAEGAGPGPGKLFSLSRHGSVVSLGMGIVSL